eukprot:snap_masked-scaffold1123_size61443-processed-gene-0.17 protein:Tk01081 transcript:snap_masked-scaffold1123_size61443-processed-gene-0.17-mRNA-1 annotation:"etoposide-induced protein"
MPRVRELSTASGVGGLSSFGGISPMSVAQILHSFLRGLVDSLRGIVHIWLLDQRRNLQKEELRIRPDIHQERLLNRDSPIKDVENFAKRRALERRERLLSDTPGGNPGTGGGRRDLPESRQRHEPSLLKRTAKCCFFNGGVFLASIWIFETLFMPIISSVALGWGVIPPQVWERWVEPVLSITFSTLWILPLFLLSKVVNAIWFQDIADSAFKFSQGRPQMMSSVSVMIADIIYSLAVEMVFLVQAKITSLLPIASLGQAMAILHLSLLNALYCFEYKWFNQGLELHRRLNYVELNWPYFLGFGLPLAVATNYFPNHIVSGCIFSILFPLFIVSANQAHLFDVRQLYARPF